MKIFAISIGGTINQRTVDGKMSVAMAESEFRSSLDSMHEHDLTFFEFSARTGVNLSMEDVVTLRNLFVEKTSTYDGIILLTGTDSLEEIAFGLDLLLEINVPVVITAAMRPSDALGYDGFRNFRDAVAVAAAPESAGYGVLVVISEDIHAARYVRKVDSQALNAFESKIGSIGKIRRGIPVFSYLDLPKTKKYSQVESWPGSITVPIVPMSLGGNLDFVDFEKIDGLILAGMGTGSLSDSVIGSLSPSITERIPVCITTRCLVGDNYDDFYYKGSLEKYTSKGFILEGYEGLSAYQARIKLLLELAVESQQFNAPTAKVAAD